MRAARILRDNGPPGRPSDEDDDLIAAIRASELEAFSGIDEDEEIQRAVELSIRQQQNEKSTQNIITRSSANPGLVPRRPSPPSVPRNPQAVARNGLAHHIHHRPAASGASASARSSEYQNLVQPRTRPNGESPGLYRRTDSASRTPFSAANVNSSRSRTTTAASPGTPSRKEPDHKSCIAPRRESLSFSPALKRGESKPESKSKNAVWEALAGEAMAESTRGAGAAPTQHEVMRRAKLASGNLSEAEQLELAKKLSSGPSGGGLNAEDIALRKAIAISKTTARRTTDPAFPDRAADTEENALQRAIAASKQTASPTVTRSNKGQAAAYVRAGKNEDVVQTALAESKALEVRKREAELRAVMAESRRLVRVCVRACMCACVCI